MKFIFLFVGAIITVSAVDISQSHIRTNICTGYVDQIFEQNVICTCPPEDIPGEPMFFRDPNDCSRFQVCTNGTAVSGQCQPGLHFNMQLKQCDHPFEPECLENDINTTTVPITSTTEYTTEPHETTARPTPPHPTTIPIDSTTMTEYPTTESTPGIPEETTEEGMSTPNYPSTTDVPNMTTEEGMSTPEYQSTTPDDLTTNYPEFTTEEGMPTPEYPTTDDQNTASPPLITTSEYPVTYTTPEEGITTEPPINTTPEELTTTERPIKTTSEEGITTERPTKTTPEVITTEEPQVTTAAPLPPFVCPPDDDEIFFPHPANCNQFYICVNGIGTVLPCPIGFLFDDELRSCRSQELVTCNRP